MKELNRLKEQKRQQMMMKKPTPSQSSNFNGGLISLENMKLDNRDNFEGEDIDPFNFGGTSNNANSITLKKQKEYMAGVKMSITEEQMKA
jgi:hypothetical protein